MFHYVYKAGTANLAKNPMCPWSYRKVARWVRAFNEEHDNVEHKAMPGRPSVNEEDVEAVSTLCFHVVPLQMSK